MGKGIQITGLKEFIRKVEEAGKRPEGLVKRALYEGAGVMADAIHTAIGTIPTDESWGTRNHKKDGITLREKAGLLWGLGVSRMKEENAGVSVVIGFAGENADGERNTTVMRRVESGTSVTKKRPTIRPTKNRTKAAALSAMQKQFEKDIQEMFND